jgi:hypothetical protein
LGDLSIDRDQREKVRPGELEQLPESKTKINHPLAMLQFRSLPSINEPAGDAAPSPLRFGKTFTIVPCRLSPILDASSGRGRIGCN